MADEFDHAAFWLPQEILTDSDGEISPKVGSGGRKMSSFGSDSDADSKPALFPFEFPYSGFGAPVEPSETESDEEDYLAGLTRRLAQYSLDDEYKRYDSLLGSKPWVSSGSPQSTLCAAGSGCSCGGQGSSRGSPNAQSPPATWDLLHAAKMRIQEEAVRFNQKSRGVCAPREHSPVTVSDFGYYLQHQQQSLSQKHLQFERLRQQQILKSNISAAIAQSQANVRFQQQNLMIQNRVRNTNNGPLGLSSSAWPPLQQAQQKQFQPNGPAYRGGVVVGAAKESTGTGVFLPRQIGAPTEYPRGKKQQHQPKQASATTVFVPAKVVHALKLNVEEMSAQSQPQVHNRFNGRNTPDYELALRLRNSSIAMAQQNRGMTRRQAPVNNEIRLPQEWTY